MIKTKLNIKSLKRRKSQQNTAQKMKFFIKHFLQHMWPNLQFPVDLVWFKGTSIWDSLKLTFPDIFKLKATHQTRLLFINNILSLLSRGKPSTFLMSLSERSIQSNWSYSKIYQVQSLWMQQCKKHPNSNNSNTIQTYK